jgi:hypothetical protein
MAKNTIYDYSTSAGSNTDIAGIGVLGTNAVNNFDDAFRTIMAQIATDVSPRRLSIQGALYGLTLSNNAGDVTNDIDIAVGMATTDSTTDPRTMVLSSALTKRLDATWAVGTNQGGLDTGTVADNTYHVWLIQRSDTGVVDATYSLSATSPTMPANFDRKRRIGSVIRFLGTILAFQQLGDVFLLTSIITNRSSTAAFAPALIAVSVPAGINVQPILQSILNTGATSNVTISMGNGTASGILAAVQAEVSSSTNTIIIGPAFWTNTSRQIYYSVTIGAGTITSNTLATLGWVDPRGRT